MTFFESLNSQFTAAQQLDLMLRIALSAVCGGIVGIERSRRFKDAGVRTHALVACAAAAMMVVSKYGFLDFGAVDGAPGVVRAADPARIAAQVVSGIGFLGVGIIYRDRRDVTRGLTTAAGILAVAGIGLAMGAGLYWIALFATVFVVFLEFVTHKIVFGKDKYRAARLEIVMTNDKEALELVHERLASGRIVVLESDVQRMEDGCLLYELVIRFQTKKSFQHITNAIAESPLILSVKLIEEEN